MSFHDLMNGETRSASGGRAIEMYFRSMLILSLAGTGVLSPVVVRSQPIKTLSAVGWRCDAAGATCLVRKVACDHPAWEQCYAKCEDVGRVWGDVPRFSCRAGCNKSAACEAEAEATRIGRLDDEIREMTRRIAVDPNDDDAYFLRARAYAAKDDHDRAIADYSERIRRNPADTEAARQIRWVAYGERGEEYQAKGDLDRAIADFSEEVRNWPTFYSGYYHRGRAYRAKGDLDRAIADLDQAIEMWPTYSRSFYERGLAWEAKHELEKALTDLTRFSKGDPSDQDGQAAVARVSKALQAR